MQALAQMNLDKESLVNLEELTLKLSMARGIEEVMATVRQYTRPIVGADGVSFILRDNGKCFYADEEAISPLWKGQRFPMEKCISGWAMLHKEVAIVEDIYADDRIPHAAYKPTFVKSLVIVPVRQDDPVAAIGAYWAQRRKPTDDEVNKLLRIAHSAAVAMTNITLFNSLIVAREEAVRAKDAVILAMASLAETRDNETGNHIRRTQHYIRALAMACRQRGLFTEEFDDETIDLLYKSAALHDIGKVGIPDLILLKPGKLDPDEFAVMKTHTDLGSAALANAERLLGGSSSFLAKAQEIVLTHHEKWDGSGYPRGLKAAEIPLSGRLMAIADVYDALVSKRVYKRALPHATAVEIITNERGKHFDPDLVDAFIEIADVFAAIHQRFADELSLPRGEMEPETKA
jgi:putative two-component system response regulator